MEQLRNIFDSDVMEKTINSVIKIGDEKDILTEIQDYVVTNEIEDHYKKFFDVYFNGDVPDTCAWISGFFGSGKSHFMKILGYLLQNQKFEGVDVVGTISNKIKKNAILAADLKNKLKKENNKIIMFSMTDVSSHDKSLLETVYSQIMISFGYSENIELAKYELTMTVEGKYEDFKKFVKEEKGEEWETFRDIKLNERNKVLNTVIPKIYPEVYKNEFKLSDVFMDVSVNSEKVAELIKVFLDINKEYSNVVILIDEIGQYVGNNEDRMFSLQGIAESIDIMRKQLKRNNVWLIVTAQQKLQDMIENFDAVAQKKFNRLSHRFSTRLDLRSEDIDRVIKDRVLRKKETYKTELGEYYKENSGAIASSLKIENSRNLHIGTTEVFVESYPFLSYHFNIARDLLQEMMGVDKKHVNYGERNMIRLTQNVLQKSMKDFYVGNFVTLDFVFDAVKQDIDKDISFDIEKNIPQAFGGFPNKELFVRTAKALFVLGHVPYISNNFKNISTCLTNDPLHPVDEKDIKEILHELIEKGFVGKTSEGGFKLLSVKEKKIEEIIRDTPVRKSDIDRERRETIKTLFKDVKSIRYNGSSFDINQTIDGEEVSKGGYIYLHVNTSNEGQIMLALDNNQEMLKWYTTEQTEINNMITRKLKLDKAISDMKDDSLEAITIKREKQTERDGLNRDIPNRIEESLREGKLVYCSFDYKAKEFGASIKNIAEKFIIDEIIPKVFNKFEDSAVNIQPNDYKKYIQDVVLVDRPKGSYPDLEQLGIMEDKEIKLSGSVYDVLYSYIINKNKWKETVLGSIMLQDFERPPYGWSQNIIRLVLAAMLRLGKIEIQSEGTRYDNYSQSKIKDIFLKDSLFKDIRLIPIVEADETARMNAKNRLATIFGKYAINTVEDLSKNIGLVCEEEREKIKSLKNQVMHIDFPAFVTNKLNEKDKIYEKLELVGDNQRITDFVKIHETELQEMFQMVKVVTDFTKYKIDEYKELKSDISILNRYEILLNGDERIEFKSKINEFVTKLNDETFIGNWQVIYGEYLKIKGKVNKIYLDNHNFCNSLYKQAANELVQIINKNNDKITEESANVLLQPLNSRICDDIKEVKNYRCYKCKKDIQALRNDMELVETLKAGITATIDKIINPPEISSVPPKAQKKNEVMFGGVVSEIGKNTIRDEGEVDEFVEELRKKLKKQIDEGKEIIIR